MQLRSRIPTAVSILMDQGTLEAHRGLTVPDPNRATTCPADLTPAEQTTWQAIAQTTQRLNQERIDWAAAIAAIREVVEALPNTSPVRSKEVKNRGRGQFIPERQLS